MHDDSVVGLIGLAIGISLYVGWIYAWCCLARRAGFSWFVGLWGIIPIIAVLVLAFFPRIRDGSPPDYQSSEMLPPAFRDR
jgi:hypothetical protein